MRFEDPEYGIGTYTTEAGFAKGIIITKEALERWRNHYLALSKKYNNNIFMRTLYLAKAGVLIDILKHFDEMEA